MPPARPRPALDDSRSESSSIVAGQRDRTNIGNGVQKSKKNSFIPTSDANVSSKSATVNGLLPATNGILDGSRETEAPQTDWTSIPIPLLHSYRAAYKISTPASFTHPHAELIYNSSDIAKRSPSQVLARRKLRDLKSHRRKLAQTNGTRLPKTAKLKAKDKEKDNASDTSRDGRRRLNGTHIKHTNGDSIAQSIEPTSPTDRSASTTGSTPSTLLNSSNPEATIIGQQSPTSLATNIRKHFNAQPLHEHDTIARFTYVMRQHGYGNAVLPSTMGGGSSLSTTAGHNVPQRTTTPIRVEGSEGDGTGWIMGSMGREVRMSDASGAFRLRFRPQI